MSIDIQELLYPLGFLSSLAFGARMLIQWFSSEYKRESLVSRNFWNLSLLGNAMLMIHSVIQMQFHVCLVQVVNGVIAWRNLNLMSNEKNRCHFNTVLKIMLATLIATTMVFIAQGLFFYNGVLTWFRIPNTPWSDPAAASISPLIHFIGIIGIILFSSRFWVQWWLAEKHRKSYLGTTFWLLSLIGTVLSLFYFIQIEDPVNFIGPAFGMIPYLRNLMLIKKTKTPMYDVQK